MVLKHTDYVVKAEAKHGKQHRKAKETKND